MGKHPIAQCDQCHAKYTMNTLITCRKYTAERQVMVTQLQKTGEVEASVKSIFESTLFNILTVWGAEGPELLD